MTTNQDSAPTPFAIPSDALWQNLGWTPSASQLAQLVTLQEQLRLWNSRLNLTRLVEGEDFWISQVVDSLWPLVERLNGPPGPLRCVDVGTGGGFPGLAGAIALPQARLTLIDSVGRQVEAVQAMRPPRTPTEIKQFLGMVGFYRAIFAGILCIIATLSFTSSRGGLNGQQ